MTNKLVTTNLDQWNAADGSGFFVIKGRSKELPDILTPIIEDALNQKMLRDATDEEITREEKIRKIEDAVMSGKITAGNNFAETEKKYKFYMSNNTKSIVGTKEFNAKDYLDEKREHSPKAIPDEEKEEIVDVEEGE